MIPATLESQAAALGTAGLLLPPVLDTEAIRRALGLKSRSGVRRLHRREGLPLARLGRRYLCTRQAFQGWLDARSADARGPSGPSRSPAVPSWANRALGRPSGEALQ
jgi:hypothetical protein